MNPKNKTVYRDFAIVDNHKESGLVGVEITRNGDFTIASAACTMALGNNGGIIQYRATGASVKNNLDKEDSTIGERLATGRALHKLSSIILSDTMADVSERCRASKEHPFKNLSVADLIKNRDNLNNELSRRRNAQAKKERKRAQFMKGIQNG